MFLRQEIGKHGFYRELAALPGKKDGDDDSDREVDVALFYDVVCKPFHKFIHTIILCKKFPYPQGHCR
jgi:hypothetical protein